MSFITSDVLTTSNVKTATNKEISGGVIESSVFLDLLTTQDITLPANRDFQVMDSIEVSSSYVLEVPATSTLEVLAYAPSVVNYGSLLSTIFSGQVTSSTNTGTWGGTNNYLNLGGFKVCWGLSATGASIGAGASLDRTVVLQTGFFNSITTVFPTAVYGGGSFENWLHPEAYSYSATGFNVILLNLGSGSSGTSYKIDWLVIGT